MGNKHTIGEPELADPVAETARQTLHLGWVKWLTQLGIVVDPKIHGLIPPKEYLDANNLWAMHIGPQYQMLKHGFLPLTMQDMRAAGISVGWDMRDVQYRADTSFTRDRLNSVIEISKQRTAPISVSERCQLRRLQQTAIQDLTPNTMDEIHQLRDSIDTR